MMYIYIYIHNASEPLQIQFGPEMTWDLRPKDHLRPFLERHMLGVEDHLEHRGTGVLNEKIQKGI